MSIYRRKMKGGRRSAFYTYEFAVNGKLYKGSTGKTKKRDAELFERDRYDEAVSGVTPAAIKPITFSAFADEYMKLHGDTKKSAYFYHFAVRILQRGFGDRLLTSINPLDCATFMAERRKDVSTSTANASLAILKHMFWKAEEWGYLAEGANPARKLKREKVRNVRDRYLRVEEGINEMADLMTACDEWLKPIYLTALCTGARRSEVLGLTVADVHFDTSKIMFLGRKNNNSTSHDMGQMLAGVLRSLPRNLPTASLFLRDGKRVTKGTLRSGFESAVKKAGLVWPCACLERNGGKADRLCGKCHGSGRDTFTFHGLRHTWATHIADGGVVSPKRLQYLGGWEDPMIMDRYTKLMPERPRISAATYAEAQDVLFTQAMQPVLSQSYHSTANHYQEDRS